MAANPLAQPVHAVGLCCHAGKGFGSKIPKLPNSFAAYTTEDEWRKLDKKASAA